MAQPQKVLKQDHKANPVEAGNSSSDPLNQVIDLPKSIVDEAFSQIGLKPKRAPLSGSFNVASGRHTSNESSQQFNQERKADNIARPVTYLRNQEKVVFNQKRAETEKQVQSLMAELTSEIARLHTQTSELSAEMKSISVNVSQTKVGIYHINFLEALLREIRNIRRKVTNSRVWLQSTYQKKQKKNYWQMAKKHGNNFTMAAERTPSGGAG